MAFAGTLRGHSAFGTWLYRIVTNRSLNALAARRETATYGNIQRDPHMRLTVGRTWHRGTAHILHDDDAPQQLRRLRRPVNDAFVLLIGTQRLTSRVDRDR